MDAPSVFEFDGFKSKILRVFFYYCIIGFMVRRTFGELLKFPER